MKTIIKKIDGNKITFDDGENKDSVFELEEWVKPSFVKLGEAEVTVSNGKVTFVNMIKDQPKKGPTKENSTDDLTTFEDLLNMAHAKFKGKFSIQTRMIENDWENKRAIFKAEILVEEDPQKAYTAYGDATQDNCGEMVKKHYIRMAETRAIARALRWATNNAKTAVEETD